jgi:hypothetical protein
MRNPGLGQGRQRLVVASGCQEREIRPCSSPMTVSPDAAVSMRLRISPTGVARAVGLSWQPARVTADMRGHRGHDRDDQPVQMDRSRQRAWGCPNSTGDSGRQARGQAVVGEVGGQERHDLGHSPVLDGEDVEPAR